MKKVAFWVVGLFLLFVVTGFFVVPPVAKSRLEQGLSEALHRKVSVESLRVNPFAPSATLRGFVVRERNGDAPFASLDELHVNVAWSSLFRLAPVVDELTLSRPHLRVVRNPDRTYNFQDLMEEFLARPPSDAPVPKFALFNLQLLDGRIDFDDRAENERHTVTDLKVGIPFVSSLPSHAEIKVLPELAAKVNGAPLGVKGEALPFQRTHAATLNVDLDAFDLTRLVDYLPFEPRAKLGSALLDSRLSVAFEQLGGGPPKVTVRGRAAVRQARVTGPAGQPLLAWQRLGVELHAIEPLAASVLLKSVELEGLELHVARARSGAINLAEILPPAGSEPAAASRPSPLALRVDRVALKSGTLRFIDSSTVPAFETALEELQLEGSGLDLKPGARSDWTLTARTGAGETLKLSAGAILSPLSAQGRVEAAGFVLKRYQPYVKTAADLELDDGLLDAALAFDWAAAAPPKPHQLKISDASLALKSLRARLMGEREPFAKIGSLQIAGTTADLGERTLRVGEIALREASASLRREKDGRLNVERIARPSKPGAAPDKDAPWRIDVAQLTLDKGSLALADHALGGEPVILQLSPLQLKAQKLSTARGERGSVSLQATINKTGVLSASGPLTLEPLGGSLAITARTVGFVPVQRYIDDKVNVAITSGALSAKGTATFAMPATGPMKASYKGDLGVTDFAAIDKRSTQDLLRWKTLSLGAVDFELAPMKVALDEIALADFYSRIVLTPEGRLNLQDLMIASAAEAPAQPGAAPAPAAQPAAVPAKTALPANVRIGRISLQGGNVNFSDFYIKPNYTANLTGVAGSVTEMTAEKAGDVDLRGKIDNAAPVEIAGRVNPLAADLFLDIKASARDIELPPLSPYAVKYAGYGITRGKLSMNVKYRLENRKLAAENNLYLDQLTFGERVESPTATKLPVTLAVALLKDRNGVIDLNLPISGSLDDPQFSLGGIIVQVIVNLIVKAITAPFALLGSLFGGGEELAYVEFAPGSSALDAEDQDRLRKLARALAERPGLRVDVGGRSDPEADREGLKREALAAKVRAQKFNELRRAGEAPPSPQSVKIDPGEYEKYLRRAYGEEKFPKPRNLIGMAKDLPVAEMETLMLTHASVGEDELRLLANARAQAAKEWLTVEGKVPAERVFLVAPKLTPEGIQDKGKPTRADFSLK